VVSNLHQNEIKNDNQHFFVEKTIIKPGNLMKLSLASSTAESGVSALLLESWARGRVLKLTGAL